MSSLNFYEHRDYLGNLYGWDDIKSKKGLIPYKLKRWFNRGKWVYILIMLLGCLLIYGGFKK